MLIKKEFEKTELNNPILFVGLPGIANMARITIDFIIEKLEAKKIREYYSKTFPALVIIGEDSRVALPKISVYHKKIKNTDYLFLIGDVQPSDEYNYDLCEEILDEFKPSKIITIGGIGTSERLKNPKIHVAHNHESFEKKLEKYDLLFDGNEVVSLIIGAAGLMIGLGELKGIKGFSLLIETIGTTNYFGIKESEIILKFLNEYFNFGLDLSVLKKEITRYEKEYKKRSKLEDDIQEYLLKHGSELDPRYIG
ncbi:MAG: hypothetical protein GON13_03355 [Nanoarchaeota archaeon]|nr:hypothetical protein [Nanoarchaeota archaeon]